MYQALVQLVAAYLPHTRPALMLMPPLLPPCRPHGKLKVSIKACWLKDAPVDFDAMTEASSFSKNELTRTSNEEDEQVGAGWERTCVHSGAGVQGPAGEPS